MIRVNLLPQHLRPIKRTPLPYLISGGVLVLAVLAVAVMAIRVQSQVNAKRAELTKDKESMKALQTIVDDCNKLEDLKIVMQAKMDVIQEIVNDRIIWSKQLWNISRDTPDNFWYTGFTESEKPTKESRMVVDPKKKSGKPELKTITVKRRFLEITGYAVEGLDATIDISPLLFKLEGDADFSTLFRISVPSIVDMTLEDRQVKKFTLLYQILRGEEAEEKPS